MTVRSVTFISEASAVRLKPLPGAAMISIMNPGEVAALQDGWEQLLRVGVADASYDERTIASYGRMWTLSSRGFPTKEHALAIRAFLDQLPPNIETLIVHCGAGISRSGAVAKFAAERFSTHFPAEYDRYNEALYRLLVNPAVFDDALALIPTKKLSLARRIGAAIGICSAR